MSEKQAQPIMPDRLYGTFYKYRSLAPASRDRLAQSITQRTIYFAPPSALNDPFDCYPNLTMSGKPEERRRIAAKVWDAGVKKVGIKVAKRHREKHVSKIVTALSDPRTRSSEFFQHIDKTTGVFCMSRNCDLPSQWAYYADSHKGLCFEFTVLEATAFTQVFQVNYVEERPTVDLSLLLTGQPNGVESMVRAVTTKSLHWTAEQEVRALQMKPGVYTYPSDMLTGIVFGMRTSAEDIHWVMSLVNASDFAGAKFYQMRPDLERYELIKSPLTGDPT